MDNFYLCVSVLFLTQHYGMKLSTNFVLLTATALLAACTTPPVNEMLPEAERTLLEGSFTWVDHGEADTSLINLDVPEATLDMPEGVNITALLFGEGNETDNLFLEHRIIANKQGIHAVMMRQIPRFILIDTAGQATAYRDFRNMELPQLLARKGRDIVVADSGSFCATHTGFITDQYLALLTPTLRCTDWDISGPWRYLDFYCVHTGGYLGSIEVPVGKSETQWIYDMELDGEDLWIHYTDMQSSSWDRYKFTLQIAK